MDEFNNDRRDFFRITDHVYIDVSILNEEEVIDLIPIINSHNHGNAEEALHSHTLQANLNRLIDQINQSDRDIARALRLLDEKITLMTHSLRQQDNKNDDRTATKVNLSAGGISFLAVEQYEVGTAVELYMEFQSSDMIIHAIAHLVSCNKAYDAPKDTPYLLRLSFTHMSEVNRSLLVKHTLSQQALERRISKEIPVENQEYQGVGGQPT